MTKFSLFQFIMVVPSLVQLVAVAAVAMLAVCLVFIPNPLCSLWVTFSIISIEAGVLGFMTLWNVKLDIISMILLVMCIGFSGEILEIEKIHASDIIEAVFRTLKMMNRGYSNLDLIFS